MGESTTRHRKKRLTSHRARQSPPSRPGAPFFESRAEQSRGKPVMPSVASFMMPAGKAVTACPEDKLRSVVDSLVNEKIGLRRCGRRGQSRRHHHEAGCQQVLPLRGENSTSTPASHVSRVPQSDPAPKATTRNDPIHAPIRPDTPRYDPDEQTTTSHRPSISETAKSSRKSFFSFSPPAPPRRRSHWTLP